MSEESQHELQTRINALEKQVSALKRGAGLRSIRKRSQKSIAGIPLYDIAIGPDPTRSEIRGHARGIIAIGDIATGVLAIGGVARGFFALGGLAIGAFALGGCSLGILVALGGLGVGTLAMGGLAIGLVAVGGGAIGMVAIGGGAVGYYACGGGAFGKYVITGMHQDPEAVSFFKAWIPGVHQLFAPRPR